MSKRSLLTTVMLVVAGTSACEPSGDDAIVATAAAYDLTVNEAVELMAGAVQVPNQPQLVQALAELWIDYMLLGEAFRLDSTLASADVSPLVNQQVEALLIIALRDEAVVADTALTASELDELYRAEAPGLRVRARHILLSTPPQATDAQKDSVRSELNQIRDRIVAGAAFEEMAQTYSHDGGSGSQGGDLGFFSPGDLVRPIEEVAFGLEIGALSEVFDSPYGVHILRVEEKEEPSLDEVGEGFRVQVQQRRQREAETAFVASIEEDGDIQAVDDAADLARQMAENPGLELTGRAARRPVVNFRGGSLALNELSDFMKTVDPDYRARVVQANDTEIVEQVLMPLVQRELLLNRARDLDLEVGQTVQDSLTLAAQDQFRAAADLLGFNTVRPGVSESQAQAIERHVSTLLGGILSGDLQSVPMGGLAFALREQFDHGIRASGIDLAVQRVATARGPSPALPPLPARPAPAPDSTSGN